MALAPANNLHVFPGYYSVVPQHVSFSLRDWWMRSDPAISIQDHPLAVSSGVVIPEPHQQLRITIYQPALASGLWWGFMRARQRFGIGGVCTSDVTSEGRCLQTPPPADHRLTLSEPDDDAAVRSRQQHRVGHDPAVARLEGKLITILPAFQSSSIAGDRYPVDAPMRASCKT